MSFIGKQVRFTKAYLSLPHTEGEEYHRLMTVTAQRVQVRKARYAEDIDDTWTEIQTNVTGSDWISIECVYVSLEN